MAFIIPRMEWHDDPNHPFAGITEKLARSNENIRNLKTEIDAFFKSSRYPILPHKDSEEWQDAVNYHRNIQIPIRFGVLIGEIVHQLRSCFDHIAWHFSSNSYRLSNDTAIQFPVISEATEKKLAGYERNIKGITDTGVRDLISDLQPYKRETDFLNHPIQIIHDMDRFDKHRELAVISSRVGLALTPEIVAEMAEVFAKNQSQTLSQLQFAVAQRVLKANVKATPHIAFVQFGNGEGELVIPGLQKLQNFTVGVMDSFAKFV